MHISICIQCEIDIFQNCDKTLIITRIILHFIYIIYSH